MHVMPRMQNVNATNSLQGIDITVLYNWLNKSFVGRVLTLDVALSRIVAFTTASNLNIT